MTREEREQLLRDTLLYFEPRDRYVTDEKGNKYFREDVILKAMELSERSLPPAEGVETIQPHVTCPKCGSTNNSELIKNDRLCYDCNHSWSEQQPTAEGAEEFLRSHKISGADFVYTTGFKNMVELLQEFAAQQQPTAEGAYGILRNIVGETASGFKRDFVWFSEAIIAMHEFATLHAQRIADKMVSERMRETCQACGDTDQKELHCRCCGNNFPT